MRSASEVREDQRFRERKRFDQAKFWALMHHPEPRSIPQSIWPALEAHLRLWGVPAGFRISTSLRRAKR